jgi:vacuolar protein sorting-associated protein 53
LQRTLEFEEELASKFGAGTEKSRSKESTNDDELEEDDEGSEHKRIAEIRNRYQKKDATADSDAKAQMVCVI